MGLFQSTHSSSVWLSTASSTLPEDWAKGGRTIPIIHRRIGLQSRNEIRVAKDHLAAGLQIGPSEATPAPIWSLGRPGRLTISCPYAGSGITVAVPASS